MPPRRIAVDLAQVFRGANRKDYVTTLGWGDPVEVTQETDTFLEVVTTRHEEQDDGSVQPVQTPGFIVPTKASGLKISELTVDPDVNDVLRVDFVDVQQGDGAVIETPRGHVVLIDGGEEQLFARYLANRYRDSREDAPREIDCIVVTHGDADHFAGLTKIHESETHPSASKQLFIHPARVYHNGLVKRPENRPDGTKRKEDELLGPTTKVGGKTYVTGLVNDLLAVPDDEMNTPFRKWKAALTAFSQRGPIAFQRLKKGDDAAFGFLNGDGATVEVLGPLVEQVGGQDGLLFLGTPKKGVSGATSFSGKSASHTINGHSIVLRLTYGNVRFLFSGDLNHQVEQALTAQQIDLTSEVLKVPHHGSADFSGDFLKAVSPVLSVVSSGDEDARVEYIHPRSTLMGALGKHSRIDQPLIFVTELVAFFRTVGYTIDQPTAKQFFAFKRDAWGIVRVRTDGHRLFVYTDSGKSNLKEAYAFRVDPGGVVTPEKDVRLA